MNVRFTLSTEIAPSRRDPISIFNLDGRYSDGVRITLCFQERLPSGNDWHGKGTSARGEARFAYPKARRKWAKFLPPLPAAARARGKRVVEVYRYLGKGERAFDERNRHGGMKPIEDVLVSGGYLQGDRDEHVAMGFAREIRSTDGRPWLILVLRDPRPCPNCPRVVEFKVKVSRAFLATLAPVPLCETCGGWGSL